MTSTTNLPASTPEQKGHVLWLDYNEYLWPSYQQAAPDTSGLLLVQDTTEAKLAFDCYDDINIVVLQLNSYKVFDSSRPDPFDFGPVNTCLLVEWLEQRNFRGRVFVISSMSLDNSVAYFKRCAPEVICMDRHEFLRQAASLLQEQYVRPTAYDIANGLLADMSANGFGDEWLDCIRDMIASWDEFQAAIGRGTEAAYGYFAQLDIFDDFALFKKQCWCSDESSEERGLWLHEYHGLYNRGIWEIIQNKPGAREMLTEQLEADIASPDDFIGEDGPFGKFLLKSVATKRRNFLSKSITPRNWFMLWPKG